MTTATVFDRRRLPLDPPLELIERIRRDAEAAELALHRGALDRDRFEATCGLLVFAAIMVVRTQCDQDGTTPIQVLAAQFAHDRAQLERRLAATRHRVAQLHFALLLERAQMVLDSPDSVCTHPGSVDFTEMPEVLLDGQWRTVIDADHDSVLLSRWRLITASGTTLPFPEQLRGRIWVRGRRVTPLSPNQPPQPANGRTGAAR